MKKKKINEITIKQLYDISYGESEPFVSWKNPGYFEVTNILSYMVRKQMEDCNSIGPIDIYASMLYEKGLDLDDLEYCFDNLINKKNHDSVDIALYKSCSNDLLFSKTKKAFEKMPEYLLQKIGLEKADYETGAPVSYLSYSSQDYLLLALDSYYLGAVFMQQNNIKEYNEDLAHKLIVKDFFADLKNCNKKKGDLNQFSEKWAIRLGLSIGKVKAIREELISYVVPDIVFAIKDFLTGEKFVAKEENEIVFDEKKLEELSNMVVGQKEAVEKIKNRLLAANVGFRQDNQPIASFLLTGPTGVGKTETAKAVADACFDGKIYVVDMSTFKNSIDVSRLTGGSPNYVGYNDKNNFCDFVKENPNCVILFDELEKAHPDCTDVVMRILDEGQFINAKGEVYSFENTVIICTTNLTQNKKTTRLGFTTTEESTEELVTGDSGFKKEIIGRFSDVIEYKNLQKDACITIAKKFLNASIKNFEKYNKRNLKLKYSEELVEQISLKANTQLLGARDLKKTIQSEFINPISSYIVTNDCKDVTLIVGPNEIKCVAKKSTKKQNVTQKTNKTVFEQKNETTEIVER